jgi:hypothetical protein
MAPRLQQTRLERGLARSLARLERWATNPWRRLSLLLLVLLSSFVIGGSLGTVAGTEDVLDQLAALVVVALLELAARSRGRLLRREGDRLTLQLLDMGRMGVLYGLLLDGFKLL